MITISKQLKTLKNLSKVLPSSQQAFNFSTGEKKETKNPQFNFVLNSHKNKKKFNAQNQNYNQNQNQPNHKYNIDPKDFIQAKQNRQKFIESLIKKPYNFKEIEQNSILYQQTLHNMPVLTSFKAIIMKIQKIQYNGKEDLIKTIISQMNEQKHNIKKETLDNCCIFLYSLSNLQIKDKEIQKLNRQLYLQYLTQIEHLCQKEPEAWLSLKPQNVIHILYSLSKTETLNLNIFEQILLYTQHNCDKFNQQDFAQFTLNFGRILNKLHQSPIKTNLEALEALLKKYINELIIEELTYLIEFKDIDMQSLTNITWGISRMKKSLSQNTDDLSQKLLLLAMQNINNLSISNFRIIIQSFQHTDQISEEQMTILKDYFINLVRQSLKNEPKKPNTPQFLDDFSGLFQSIYGLNTLYMQEYKDHRKDQDIIKQFIQKYAPQFTINQLSYLIASAQQMNFLEEAQVIDLLTTQFLQKIKLHPQFDYLKLNCLVGITWSTIILEKYNEQLLDILFEVNPETNTLLLEEQAKNLRIEYQILQIISGLKLEQPQLYEKYSHLPKLYDSLIEILHEKSWNKMFQLSKKRLSDLKQVQNLDIHDQQNLFNIEEMFQFLSLPFHPEKVITSYPIDFVLHDLSVESLKDLKIKFKNVSHEELQNQLKQFKEQEFQARYQEENKLDLDYNKESTLCIEINGRTHFRTLKELNNRSKFKKRILEKSGHKVLILGNRQCYRISLIKDLNERIQYFLDLLIDAMQGIQKDD